MTQKSFIQEMLNLQNLKVKYRPISALGTFLVLLVSLFPFSNNIIELLFPQIKQTYIQAADSYASTVIWCLSMCIQTSFIIVIHFMRPYIVSYVFPLFTSIYSSSFYVYYLFGARPNENFWFFFYICLSVIIVLFIIYALQINLKIQRERNILMKRTVRALTDGN